MNFKIITTLLMTLLITACGLDSTYHWQMQQGQHFFEQAKYHQAKAAFEKALDEKPDAIESQFMLAETNLKLGAFKTALLQYQNILALNDQHLQAHLRVAELYLKSGQISNARLQVERAVQLQPDNQDVWLQQGRIALSDNNTDGAIVKFQKILQYHPGEVSASLELAEIYYQSGQLLQGIKTLQSSLTKNQKNTTLRVYLAKFYARNGAVDSAIQMLEQAIRIKPKQLNLREQLAYYYDSLGKAQQAESTLRLAIKNIPGEESVLLLVDYLKAKQGNEVALAELLPWQVKLPKAFALQMKAVELQQENTEQAKQALQQILTQDWSEAEKRQARLALARLYLKAGHTEQANVLVTKILTEFPGNDEALLLQGQVSLAKAEINAAIKDFRTVLQHAPENISALKALAAAHIAKNNLLLAEENLQKAINLAPGDVNLRMQFVNVLLGRGLYTAARQQVIALLQIDPEQRDLLKALFRIAILQKDWTTAQQIAKTIQRMKQHEAQGYYMSGLAYQAQGEWQKSIQSFGQALTKKPEGGDALTQLVKSYLALKQPEKAMHKLKTWRKKYPSSYTAYNLTGDLLLAQKKYKKAEQAYRHVLQLQPQWTAAYQKIALLNLARKKPDAAIKIYRQGIDKTQGDYELIKGLARLYEMQEKYSLAITLLEAALKQHPNEPGVANTLALFLTEYGIPPKALARAEEILAPYLSADNLEIMDTAGWLAYKQGNYPKAKKLLQSVIQLHPENPIYQYHIGMVYYKQGEIALAKPHLDKAVATQVPYHGLEEANQVLQAIQPADVALKKQLDHGHRQ